MIELKHDKLVVSFPDIHAGAVLTVDFQRTLRIPDDGRDYPLPPGLGSFPLRHIDDFAERVPAKWLDRGGLLLPMWQSEALWLNFDSAYIENRDTDYPFAIKVGTGKISAVTGKPWQRGLSRNPQDYLVAPKQPWLDGYCVEKGVIRQFVAMPLGQGYSVEEQLTGEAEFGGLQIEVFPMREEVFEKRFPVVDVGRRRGWTCGHGCFHAAGPRRDGVGPGRPDATGNLRGPLLDSRLGHRARQPLFHSPGQARSTGNASPAQIRPRNHPRPSNTPKAGYPWFDYYDAEAKAIEGSEILAGVKSVTAKIDEQRGLPLPGNQSLETPKVVKLRPGHTGSRSAKKSTNDDDAAVMAQTANGLSESVGDCPGVSPAQCHSNPRNGP